MSFQLGIIVTILLINRAEEVFAGAKDTVNMTERREWNSQLAILCEAAESVADDNKEKPTPQQLKHLEKTIAHLLRFPDLENSQTLLKVLSRNAMEELL